jgi:hypothetical protein
MNLLTDIGIKCVVCRPTDLPFFFTFFVLFSSDRFQSCCNFCGVAKMLLAAPCSFSVALEFWIKITVPVFLLLKKKTRLTPQRKDIYCCMRSPTDRVTRIVIADYILSVWKSSYWPTYVRTFCLSWIFMSGWNWTQRCVCRLWQISQCN